MKIAKYNVIERYWRYGCVLSVRLVAYLALCLELRDEAVEEILIVALAVSK